MVCTITVRKKNVHVNITRNKIARKKPEETTNEEKHYMLKYYRRVKTLRIQCILLSKTTCKLTRRPNTN